MTYAICSLVKELRHVTKKEIVKTISESCGLTQLQTKEIVQKTFEAIIDTLVEDSRHRIELRNFGVFEVKKRAARLLGISFRSFRYRLEKLGIEDPEPGA